MIKLIVKRSLPSLKSSKDFCCLTGVFLTLGSSHRGTFGSSHLGTFGSSHLGTFGSSHWFTFGSSHLFVSLSKSSVESINSNQSVNSATEIVTAYKTVNEWILGVVTFKLFVVSPVLRVIPVRRVIPAFIVFSVQDVYWIYKAFELNWKKNISISLDYYRQHFAGLENFDYSGNFAVSEDFGDVGNSWFCNHLNSVHFFLVSNW